MQNCEFAGKYEQVNNRVCIILTKRGGGEKTKVINEVVLLNSFKVCQTTKVFSINFLY